MDMDENIRIFIILKERERERENDLHFFFESEASTSTKNNSLWGVNHVLNSIYFRCLENQTFIRLQTKYLVFLLINHDKKRSSIVQWKEDFVSEYFHFVRELMNASFSPRD